MIQKGDYKRRKLGGVHKQGAISLFRLAFHPQTDKLVQLAMC